MQMKHVEHPVGPDSDFSFRMSKHLYQLPSVAVVFMELDWGEANFNEKKLECASRVQTVK